MAMRQPLSPPRQIRADARRNVERLIAAADAEFAERGSAASLDEIAKQAGVGPGTLYRHFPSREALIGAVLREQFEDLHQQATALTSTVSPDVAIERWLRGLLANAMTYHGVAAHLINEAIDNHAGINWPHSCEQVHADGEAMVAMARDAGVIRDDLTFPDIARLLTGIALSLAHAPVSTQTADRLFRVAMDGIRHQPAREPKASSNGT